ncbi:ATP-binding protein [Teichococcus vastitatis]|uniref:histidine kinase n=1 Tax=Teichococcus vastitatis TaxID=2307076 RepID=A0ABS9W2D0_9PROT|nr:ATP-binding protein [Pseudoroseomonas vastitatis]MCI0753457.1 MASE4 domain-containing protein [Pseudoroseomonas vastitatis]
MTQSRPVAAAAVALALLLALLVTTPFATRFMPGTEVIVPAYAAAAFMLEAITGVLLLALYNVQRAPALLILALGYLFSALLLPGWVLTFPGVFTAFGLGEDLQATASIAALRRTGFALFLLGYAVSPMRASMQQAGATIRRTVLGLVTVVAAAMWLIVAAPDILPVFMQDERVATPLWRFVPHTAMALYLLTIAILLRRRRVTLDLWICLVAFSLAIELALLSYLAEAVRLSLGWWTGRICALLATGVVTLVMLSDTIMLHTRLAQSVAAEQRARQNRLTAMEALSASIAHEINQPLASMITNADAGLRWLARTEPRIDRAEAALQRIVADGHRANKVVFGIRTMFLKGAQERVPVEMGGLIRQAVESISAEARLAGITVELALDLGRATVIGNPVQLLQVVANLIENGLDALRAVEDRQRVLSLGLRRGAEGDVELLVADTGIGLTPGLEERIFEPFFSGKPEGMGMGLMFCRTVVEAHGGRLWATPNRPRGAVFHVTLPGVEPSIGEARAAL